ncbi:fumarylacetoacetase [Glutamicibacter sp.]|uniref:fumarylacetoacetase n=1 Tax=Glutamicibacter sp. TaxID=1931995 RepID=UPI002B4A9E5C|nr:fumarylacetoacetase [Glutamicibacter sp.]HJX78092.1 fumarylacetoacetase [Glutamicibacter sp.]
MPTLAENLARTESDGFGLAHLPYASFSAPGSTKAQLGIRLGDNVYAVATVLEHAVNVSPEVKAVAESPNLDALLTAGHMVWSELRECLRTILTELGRSDDLLESSYPVGDVHLHMPFTVGDYVDFYGNEHHATNVGRIFRPTQPPLTPNWKHLPIGYHGRSGSIIPSNTPVPRPKGMRPEIDADPSFGVSRRLDIEAEIGFVLGGSAPTGEVKLEQADHHIFGLTLTNDWSARDIQAFEYVPLGPNLGKSFATSISPWVTPIAALEFARTAPPVRDTPLAEYLDDADLKPWGFEIQIEVILNGETVARPPFASTYWTAAQMLAHMTVNGATLRPGDFFAGGTISGPEKNQRGSFLELSWGGEEPLALADGSEFTFLRDGDTVTLRATASTKDGTFIRLGDCSGTIVPSC